MVIIFKCICSFEIITRRFCKQNRESKENSFEFEIYCIDFRRFAYKQTILYKETKILVRGDCLKSKGVQREEKKNNYVEMTPSSFNSAIAPMSPRI